MKKLNLFFNIALLLFIFLNTKIVFSITTIDTSNNSNNFLYKLSNLKTSLNISIIEYLRNAYLPSNIIAFRIKNYEKNPIVEPITIYFKNYIELKNITERIANSDKNKDILYKLLLTGAEKTKSNTLKTTLNAMTLNYLNLDNLSKYFAYQYYDIAIPTNQFFQRPHNKKVLLKQLDMFLSAHKIKLIKQKLQFKNQLLLKEDLLPDFPLKVIGKYSPYKGPNCFHAALGFNDYKLIKSNFVNIIEEKNYHRAMINNDELWILLSKEFYEVKGKDINLKYGDMIVFFDLPTTPQEISYKFIKHATTYLFGPYTFSKASKYSDTPYVINTLQKEWSIWKKLTTKLGLKVYRKINKNLSKIPPPDLNDWLN